MRNPGKKGRDIAAAPSPKSLSGSDIMRDGRLAHGVLSAILKASAKYENSK